ncbi:MAG: polysaccharide deacetylase, partial [Clostridiales bacterium]|nr:polysaccharide deacetylase [Clostridiales bacterium]
GHSYEFNNNDNWDVIERFCDKMGGRDDIWYATNGMIYDYVKAYEALDATLDGSVIKNPTSIDVYFESDGVKYAVKAGETLRIG